MGKVTLILFSHQYITINHNLTFLQLFSKSIKNLNGSTMI